MDYGIIVFSLRKFYYESEDSEEVKAMNEIPIAVWAAVFCCVLLPLIVRARRKKQ
jgi:hypothetical protein